MGVGFARCRYSAVGCRCRAVRCRVWGLQGSGAGV